MDGPHHGLKIYKFTKWTDPTMGKNIRVHEVNRPHHGLKIYEFTKWTDPTMG